MNANDTTEAALLCDTLTAKEEAKAAWELATSTPSRSVAAQAAEAARTASERAMDLARQLVDCDSMAVRRATSSAALSASRYARDAASAACGRNRAPFAA
jgi:hypothetical protein